MHALYRLAVAAFACAGIGADAWSQFPAPDWSAAPAAAVKNAGDVNGDGFEDVIVGTWGFANPQIDEGRASIYLGSATGLGLAPVWVVEGNQASAKFGWSVAGAGDVNGDGFADVLVGAPYFDSGIGDEGRVYLYLGSPTGPSTTPSWTQNGPGFSNYLGWVLSTAGDVNGDGLDDVIVGMPGNASAAAWLGNTSGVLVFNWQGFPRSVFDAYGNSVAGAGDVNGDGYDDVIVGAPLTQSSACSSCGSVFAYLGSSGGLSSTPFWTHQSNLQDDVFGIHLASAGDVNDDGFGDIAVTASGGVHVFRGGSPASLTEVWSASSPGSYFGRDLSSGDLNGDGYDDLIIGDPYYNVTTNGEEGRVTVYEGSSAGLSSESWSAVGYFSEHIGFSVGAGDVNGDGYSDMVVTDDVALDGTGSVHAYHGSRFGLYGPPKHHRPPPVPRQPVQ